MKNGGLILLAGLIAWSLMGAGGVAGENPLAHEPPPEERGPVAGDESVWRGLGGLLLKPLSFYSNILSRIDGDRCPSTPNCSLYAHRAVAGHGPLLGLWMTVDRLIHERTEIRRGRPVRGADGVLRVADPLAENDFWLLERREGGAGEKERIRNDEHDPEQ